jgi:hypothetical protein
MPPVCLSSLRQQYYSEKRALSFAVFCREKPKSEYLVPSRQSDFAGMMRPGHDQSTPFGLSATRRISTAPDFGRAKLLLCLGHRGGERRGASDKTSKNIALLILQKCLGVAAATPYRGNGAPYPAVCSDLHPRFKPAWLPAVGG